LISHSKSFLVLKEQNQTLFNFAVLCCRAVPALKGYMKAVDGGSAPKLPDADHFKGDPDFTQLRAFTSEYKKTLGRVIFLSSFSYFEAYFKALIEEVLQFHGGQENFVQAALTRQATHFAALDRPEVEKSASKLREYKKGHFAPSYRKHIKALEQTDYRFPSELFSLFGIVELNNYKDLKSSQIPHVAKWCFGLELTRAEEEKFSGHRDTRNEIAHGSLVELDFKRGLDATRFLRELSIKIDKHVLRHFLVIERA
jgi:RiboL-PSP-HEPN